MKKVISIFLLVMLVSTETFYAQVLPDGDFEGGTIGSASTQFTLGPCNISIPSDTGDYCVTGLSTTLNPSFMISGVPVTPCEGNFMMCFDGNPNGDRLVWGQTATDLEPGCEYELCFCLTSISNGQSFNFLYVMADGDTIAPDTLDATIGWTTHCFTFIASSNTAFIEIRQNTTVQIVPYNFAIDNITLTATGICESPFCSYLINPNDPNRPRSDRGNAIASTPDGGFIVVGTVNEAYGACTVINTQACSNDESDIYVAKYSGNMTLEFDLRIGEVSTNPTKFFHETGIGVLVRSDGYYILGDVLIHNTGAVTNFDNDILVTKLNLEGGIAWSKRFGSAASSNQRSREYAAAILDMTHTDGTNHILVTGSTNRHSAPIPNNESNWDFLAIKLDTAGTILTRRAYFSGATNELREMNRDAVRFDFNETSAYALVGEVFLSETQPDRRIFAVSIDQNLNLISNFNLDNPETTERALTVTYSGSDLYMAGAVEDTSDTNTDMFVIRLNQDLNMVANSTYSIGTDDQEFISDIQWMSDGKLLVLAQDGNSRNGNTVQSDGRIMTINPISLVASQSEETNRAGFDERYNSLSNNYYITGYWDFNAYASDPLLRNREFYIGRISNEDNSSCCTEFFGVNTDTLTGEFIGAGQRNPAVGTLDHKLSDSGYILDYICNTVEFRSSPYESRGHGGSPVTKLLIAPNPNFGYFELKSLDQTEIQSVEIYDFSGRLVYEQKYTTNAASLQLNLSSLTAGFYLVNATTKNGKNVLTLAIEK